MATSTQDIEKMEAALAPTPATAPKKVSAPKGRYNRSGWPP